MKAQILFPTTKTLGQIPLKQGLKLIGFLIWVTWGRLGSPTLFFNECIQIQYYTNKPLMYFTHEYLFPAHYLFLPNQYLKYLHFLLAPMPPESCINNLVQLLPYFPLYLHNLTDCPFSLSLSLSFIHSKDGSFFALLILQKWNHNAVSSSLLFSPTVTLINLLSCIILIKLFLQALLHALLANLRGPEILRQTHKYGKFHGK